MLRLRLCLLPLTLILCACEPAGRPGAEAASAQRVAPTPAPAAPPQSPAPEQVRVAPSKQTEAQAYLDQARAAAEQRHRKALTHCETVVADDRDACIQSAEDGLLAEMRAARVEYDARMSQPE